MAARPYGGKLALTTSATSLTALIKVLRPTFRGSSFGAGVLRAEETNTDRVFVLNEAGDLLGYIRPGEELDMTNLGSVLQTDFFFLKAVIAQDAVYAFLVEW